MGLYWGGLYAKEAERVEEVWEGIEGLIANRGNSGRWGLRGDEEGGGRFACFGRERDVGKCFG